jgi:hypothetical protein
MGIPRNKTLSRIISGDGGNRCLVCSSTRDFDMDLNQEDRRVYYGLGIPVAFHCTWIRMNDGRGIIYGR